MFKVCLFYVKVWAILENLCSEQNINVPARDDINWTHSTKGITITKRTELKNNLIKVWSKKYYMGEQYHAIEVPPEFMEGVQLQIL